MENTGKPMRVAFQCTEDDVQWAGMECSEEQPCRLYLELSAVESVGNRIFLAGNLHSAATTLYSILLASDDAGKTWREAFQRLRGCGLDHIQFVDFETGWVSGESLVPLPADPFLLITSDGGKTWRQNPIFSESRPGAIQQFWFSSKANGSMVIDRGASDQSGRYELYNSPNGGESWTVKEASDKPLKLRRTGAPNTDWRIAPDRATQSFRIERRVQGEKWTTLASFSIPIGVCKIQ
jgi:photosystem II stability/assembly factor-like uncharacterized protein